MTAHPGFSRRALLKNFGGGALVISVGATLSRGLFSDAALAADAGKPPLLPSELDSFIAVKADGSISAFFGKVDLGHGMASGIAQLVAEELDCPWEAVTVYVGDTDTSVNQGGASGSNGIQLGGRQMRYAAAEARRVLVEMAAARLGATPDQVTVTDGRCTANGKSVTYGALVGGRYLNTKLDWNKEWGNGLRAIGKAKPKDAKDFKLIGKPLPRGDVAWKAFGTGDYITEVKLPGMLHGRVIRPRIAGAVPVTVDETSIAAIAGAKVWRKGDFIGVTAPREWDAIRAQRALAITWSSVPSPFTAQQDIYDYIRKATPRQAQVDKASATGDVDAAFAGAARIVEAEYEWPYQSHASMGGACAVASFSPEGELRCFVGTQKPHGVQSSLSNALELPTDKIHVKWMPAPGSYGRNDADDCIADAALLARLSGKPVRMQYMRGEATGWDPKAPASVHKARAALDAQGNVIAFDFNSKGFSLVDAAAGATQAGDTLMGQLTGAALNSADAMGVPAEPYKFPNKRQSWAVIAPQLDRASPLRTSHLRDPGGPQIAFASESFMDELAAATGSDPVAFRLKYLTDERAIAVIKKAAELFGWDTRPSPRKDQTGPVMTGRGFAYTIRGDTRVAMCAEVSVNRETGRVQPLRFAVAHDCGQVLNPRSLKTIIEGNVVHSTSRALKKRFVSAPTMSPAWTGSATDPDICGSAGPHRYRIARLSRRADGRRGRAFQPCRGGGPGERHIRCDGRSYTARSAITGASQGCPVVGMTCQGHERWHRD